MILTQSLSSWIVTASTLAMSIKGPICTKDDSLIRSHMQELESHIECCLARLPGDCFSRYPWRHIIAILKVFCHLIGDLQSQTIVTFREALDRFAITGFSYEKAEIELLGSLVSHSTTSRPLGPDLELSPGII